MRLILHIGTEKTGTTSIQACLYANRVQLSRQGVFLSDVIDQPCNRALAHAFQESVDSYFWPQGIRTKEAVSAFRDRLKRSLAAEVKVASLNHDYMVISAEHLQSRLLTIQEVERLAAFLKELFSGVKVICYIRHQVEMRKSLYSTLVRQGYTEPLENFDSDIDETSLYYNHLELSRRWGEAFGKENLILREYAFEKLHKGDVVRDFFAQALPEMILPESSFLVQMENASLSDLHVRTYRLINRWFPYSDRFGSVTRTNARVKRIANLFLKFIGTASRRKNVSLQERDIRKQISSRFLDSNRCLASEYFGGKLFAAQSTDNQSGRDQT